MKKFFLLLVLVLVTGLIYSQSGIRPAQLNDGILSSYLSGSDLDSELIGRLDTAIDQGIFPNIHSLLLCVHNVLVYEKYWPGKDEILGYNLGIRAHGMDSLHDLRSISKSVVSACIGIAIKQGKIKSTDQKIFDFFPEYAKLDTGMKKNISIQHLLTMSPGWDWNEDLSYIDPSNSETRMDRSRNPTEFILSQPMVNTPGKVWKYNGGTTQILAAIIEKASGKTIDLFAKEYIFDPLGITGFEWLKGPASGDPLAASGLRLRSRDLLKFGMLYMNGGTWKNKQIIPAEWVDKSLQSHIDRTGNPGAGGYGYQFWTITDSATSPPLYFAAAVGNGDQRIFFDRKDELLVVVTAGNYNNRSIKKNSHAMMREYIVPALKNKKIASSYREGNDKPGEAKFDRFRFVSVITN
jgi:CubicO group peptidase (beta-lactamase class C family)